MAKKAPTRHSVQFDKQPGHLMRRMHQISVGIFMSEAESTGLTPVQFAALQAVSQQPGIDQKTLAKVVALDTSTTGGVIDRLEAREFIERRASDQDRRVRLLFLTPEGEKKLDEALPVMLSAQEKILSPLSAAEQQTFMQLLSQLVNENNAFSRAPSQSTT
jgi:DNA-binding MarR family transcriptional regulator